MDTMSCGMTQVLVQSKGTLAGDLVRPTELVGPLNLLNSASTVRTFQR